MLASSPWNPAFSERVAFIDLSGRQTSWTADRREFIGRNGSLAMPQALREMKQLSGRVGSGLDPCGALQTRVGSTPGARGEVVFFLGDSRQQRRGEAADRPIPEKLIFGMPSFEVRENWKRDPRRGSGEDAGLGRWTS